ncbi:MAG: transcriptional regulator [Syntrophobacteraceae bacterium]|jgi:DNA-binding phage protein
MALTKGFRTTLMDRARRDADFRQAMLKEGIDTMLAGDVETGKAILRDYINSAVGFVQLAEAVHIPAKSLMRMFGPKGNLRVDNLFQVIRHLQAHEGIRLEVGEQRASS